MGARRLTLLRHGKAQSIDACAEDFERTLTHRGRRSKPGKWRRAWCIAVSYRI